MAVAAPPRCSFPTTYNRCCPFGLCTDAVSLSWPDRGHHVPALTVTSSGRGVGFDVHAYLPTARHGVGRMVSLRAGGWPTIFARLLHHGLILSYSFYWAYMVCRSGLVSTCCGATLRVRIFLKYVLIDALCYSSAPGPSRDRGNLLLAAWS